jgi:PhoD-like phosphatase
MVAVTEEEASPQLLLGPLLRYVSTTESTIWVETDRDCQVAILGRAARTFEVAGHHYGLVVIDGLEPGSEHDYQVELDGVVRWPLPGAGLPPSVLRTVSPGGRARVAFGSCRVAEIASWDRSEAPAEKEPAEEGPDALAAWAAMLRAAPRDSWPDVLLMIGDQVYADEPGPATRRFIAARRGPGASAEARQAAAADVDPSAPAGEVADFAEYRALYHEAWSEPEVRWLLSTVPTAMIFDDHDMHDDWNTSAAWRREFSAKPWWGRRIESAYQSYWVYQHLGNLSPAELAADEAWGKVCQPGDAAPVLADLAHRADQRAPGVRWSFARTYGTAVRVVVLDSRSRRVVDGRRLMADEDEWRWLVGAVSGDWEHLVIATSVPPLLPRGIHALEAWTERLAAGAWGGAGKRLAERLRQKFDLEHWPAFGASFKELEQLLIELAAGEHSPSGTPPRTVTVIAGDIHHSYLAEVALPGRAGPASRSRVYEAVCSPFHQAMPSKMRAAQRLASGRLSGLTGAAVATLAGAHVPRTRWRTTAGPWFANMLATLEYDGDRAAVRFDRALNTTAGPRLAPAAEAPLS